MQRIAVSILVLVLLASAAGCGEGASTNATGQDADVTTIEDPAAPHGIEISLNEIEAVDERLEVVPDSVFLNPAGTPETITAALERIEEQADRIPEDLGGKQPEVLFGALERINGAERPNVVLLRFTDVLSAPVGQPIGAEAAPGPGPAQVIAAYDSSSGDEVAVWVVGCGADGSRCAR